MNPDGAERNRPWFSDPPKLSAYLEHATRELPGDDIEFGFGAGEDVRPECRAAQEFLRSAAPFTAHFSLHGMAFAEGAWCLMNPEWADRAGTFMDSLSGLCSELDVPMHDVDRKGEKGFTRLREGFSTTPNSVAMKRFFVERGDAATASLFMPSSMEWIRSLGGDPLCIVTELPLFLIGKRSPSLSEAISNELREDLSQLRAMRGEERSERMTELTRTYDLRPMPLDLQVRLQVAMIVLGLHLTESPS